MAYDALQLVIGLALVDPHYKEALLHDRARAILELPLTEEEVAVLMTIKARTFEEFSGKLDRWIARKTEAVGVGQRKSFDFSWS